MSRLVSSTTDGCADVSTEYRTVRVSTAIAHRESGVSPVVTRTHSTCNRSTSHVRYSSVRGICVSIQRMRLHQRVASARRSRRVRGATRPVTVTASTRLRCGLCRCPPPSHCQPRATCEGCARGQRGWRKISAWVSLSDPLRALERTQTLKQKQTGATHATCKDSAVGAPPALSTI